jgi:hypothetical protein
VPSSSYRARCVGPGPTAVPSPHAANGNGRGGGTAVLQRSTSHGTTSTGPDRVYVRDVLLTRGHRQASTGRKLVSVLAIGQCRELPKRHA